jgi:hypothetical protein
VQTDHPQPGQALELVPGLAQREPAPAPVQELVPPERESLVRTDHPQPVPVPARERALGQEPGQAREPVPESPVQMDHPQPVPGLALGQVPARARVLEPEPPVKAAELRRRGQTDRSRPALSPRAVP